MLKGFQKKYLRGRAHKLKPVVFVGQKGITDAVLRSINEALDKHELIKLKFTEFKEKDQKTKITDNVVQRTGCESAGIIGHIAIFYRPHKDPEKRKIKVPEKRLP